MSMVILVKNKQVASLAEMNKLALKRIFDKFHMTREEETLLEHSVDQWPRKADLKLEEKRMLKVIIQALIDNENGKFNYMKEAMVQHGLDYKKVYDVGL